MADYDLLIQPVTPSLLVADMMIPTFCSDCRTHGEGHRQVIFPVHLN